MKKRSHRDTSSCEFLGTFRLIEKILSEGLAVAKPFVDDGVDLVVYADRKSMTDTFVAVPLQLKCFSEEGFVVDEKYLSINGLFIAYIWHSRDHNKLKIFALPYATADKLAKRKDGRPFKRTKGIYTATTVPAHIKKELAPFEISACFRDVFFPEQKRAEPGTTDKPNDAQRLRYNH